MTQNMSANNYTSQSLKSGLLLRQLRKSCSHLIEFDLDQVEGLWACTASSVIYCGKILFAPLVDAFA
ncbi:hypothetical protein VNO80_20320 [Phaseolus coccineus]|uniref:Uncharacterized protein n=1 Tax=Phaseolus coccineus TaxID=3886 RepID=A0AAN9MNV6_PHACN